MAALRGKKEAGESVAFALKATNTPVYKELQKMGYTQITQVLHKQKWMYFECAGEPTKGLSEVYVCGKCCKYDRAVSVRIMGLAALLKHIVKHSPLKVRCVCGEKFSPGAEMDSHTKKCKEFRASVMQHVN